MSFKVGRIKEGKLITFHFFTYEDLKDYLGKELETFKDVNKVNKEEDKYYIAHVRQMERTLQEYRDGELDKCFKCTKEEHEGVFCRCESRNIRIAKKQREDGNSSWKSDK